MRWVLSAFWFDSKLVVDATASELVLVRRCDARERVCEVESVRMVCLFVRKLVFN